MKSSSSISIFSEFGTGKRIDKLLKIIPEPKQKREADAQYRSFFYVNSLDYQNMQQRFKERTGFEFDDPIFKKFRFLSEKRGIKSIRRTWDFYHHLVMPISICMDNSSFDLFPEWIHWLPGKNLSPYYNEGQLPCPKTPAARLCTNLRGYPDKKYSVNFRKMRELIKKKPTPLRCGLSWRIRKELY